MRIKTTMALLLLCCGMSSQAQLNKNPNKFLGNITTMGQIRSDFDTYWDQLTPENETKWASIEGTRDQFNWDAVDREYNYCKEHGFAFKFHTLIWGGQYPSWMNNLSQKEQLEEIEEWFDAVHQRYPDLEYIDVVNEALSGHNPAPFKAALGGDGTSGYDWIVKSFQMARELWPDAVLIYNDYNTFQWDTDRYIDLVQRILKAGAPVDAAGCQSHDLNDMEGEDFRAALEKVHKGTGLPIFISEYDICKMDDQEQLKRYKQQFPILWEAEYVAGVTLWGYIYGATWVNDGNSEEGKGASGLIKNGVERPALKWLREYMLTDTAITAKSTLVRGARDYAFISPSESTIMIGDKTIIKGRSSSANDEIAEVRVYKGFNGDTALCAKFETSAIEFEWSTLVPGDYTFKMQVLSSVSSTLFEKFCSVKACEPAKPFHGTPIVLPGKFEAEDFDLGENTIAYSDNDVVNSGYHDNGTFYRDTVGVDIDKNDGDGYVIGWTYSGEWVQYTVTVEEEQLMMWTARVSSGTTGSAFRIYMGDIDLTGKVNVPQTASNSWGKYTEIKGRTNVAMPAGTYALRLVIEGNSCNIDNFVFEAATGDEKLTQPYKGMAATIPGIIEVENYDSPLDGYVAQTYSDSDSNNEGDANFRTGEGVDIYQGHGGYVLGMTMQNEWLMYTVNIEKTQKYYWGAVVSSGLDGSAFHLYVDDKDITGKINVPNTGSWDTYNLVKGETKIEVPQGTHTLKMVIDASYCNIDKIVFSTEPVDDGVLVGIAEDRANCGVYDVFTIMGVYRGTVEITDGNTSVLSGRFEQGIYILRNKANGEAKRVMVN